MKRGSLIVFEGTKLRILCFFSNLFNNQMDLGLDRSGKTTQCKRVRDFLKNQDKCCHFMRFPGSFIVLKIYFIDLFDFNAFIIQIGLPLLEVSLGNTW
jgi:hypothetical protein